MVRRYIIVILCIFFEANICAYSQNKNKNIEDDPMIAIMQVDSVFVGGQLTRKEKRAQRERRQVAKLLRYMVEDHKFQFDAHFSYYRGSKRDAYWQSFRCYGGRIISSLILLGGSDSRYGGNGLRNCTTFKIKNIHSDNDNDYLIHFDVVMNVTAIVDGHTYDQVKYEFVTNILNAKTAVRVIAGKSNIRECGIFTGYINTLR